MDPADLRAQIPFLAQDDPPIYFDNACMTLKPRSVIEAIQRYYEETPVCAGRSTHRLARRVSDDIQASREAVARFLDAKDPGTCVFTRNTTEAINLAVQGLELPEGSTVLTSDREHNSGLVPAQRLAAKGITHEALPSRKDETFDLEAFKARMEQGDVSLVSVVHMSNLDGYVTPLADIAEIAHDHDALVLADGAQSAPHMPVSVRDLGVDLFAFSVHKMMGPTGVGVLWGREEILDEIEPLIAGGSTIEDTTLEGHTFLAPPGRFEAGLQDFAGLVATRYAIETLEGLGLDGVHAHEAKLSTRLQDGIEVIGGTIIGAPAAKGNGIVSFELPGLDIHQLAILLEDKGQVMVRAGLHCLNSWFNARGLDGSCRASLYAYNTMDEVEACLATLETIAKATSG